MSHDSRIHVDDHRAPKSLVIPASLTNACRPDAPLVFSASTDERQPPTPRTPRKPSTPEPRRVRCFWCDRIHVGPHPLAVCAVCRASYETLRSLDMRGSYVLSDRTIDAVLRKHAGPGNFALGYMDGDAFSVYFVGRSDLDVRASLHDWVGMPSAQDTFASNAKAPWATHARGASPLAAPMLGRVGSADTGYTHFAFSYADTATAAFEKELRNFDDFGGLFALDNVRPPMALV